MKTLFALALTLLTLGVAQGQDSLGIALISSTYDYWLGCNSITTIDNRIFVGNGKGGIREIAIDGEQMTVINRFKPVRPIYISRIGDCIAAVTERKLSIIDPDSPHQILSQIPFREISQYRFVVKDDFIYLKSDGEFDIYIIDCSDLEHPFIADTLNTPEGWFEASDISGDNLFVAYESENGGEIRLAVFDISDPPHPRELTDNLFQGMPFGAFDIQDSLMVVWAEDGNEGLKIFDISDPANAELVGSLDLRGEFVRLWIEGADVFGLVSYHQLTRIDISDPSSPRVIGCTPRVNEMRDFLKVGNVILMTTENVDPGMRLSGGIAAFRLEEDNMPLVGYIAPVGRCGRFVETEDGSFLCGGMMAPYQDAPGRYITTSLKMIDFEEPWNPGVERYAFLEGIFFEDNTAPLEGVATKDSVVFYANQFNNGLCFRYDGDDRLRAIGEFDAANDVALQDTLLYAAVERQIYVYGVSNPDAPRLLTRISAEVGMVERIILHQNNLVAEGENGIRFFNLDDPAQPEPIGEILAGRSGICFRDEFMFGKTSSDGHYNLEISDVSNQENIRQISLTDVSHMGSCYIAGNYLFIGGSKTGLVAFDVTDLESPFETGHYFSDEIFTSLIVQGNYLMASHETHISTYDVSALLGVQTPPRFVNPPNEVFFNETDTVRFVLRAVDLNNDSLTFGMLENRDLEDMGAQFTDNRDGTATFLWVTTYDYSGIYQTTFSVTDGDAEVFHVMNIHVAEVNRLPTPPELVIPADNSSVPDDSTVVFVWNRAFDPDGDRLGYLLKVIGPTDLFYYGTGNNNSYSIRRSDIVYLFNNDVSSIVTWEVLVFDRSDTVHCASPFRILPPLDVSDDFLQPSGTALSAFPNPFNSTVTITFSTGKDARPTRLGVYDVQGRMVADLMTEYPLFNSPPASRGGKQTVVWDASGVGAGVYFVRLEAGTQSRNQKILLLR